MRPAERLFEAHAQALRDPAQVAGAGAAAVDPRLLLHHVQGPFWQTLAAAKITVLLTREYEHLVLALSAPQGKPRVSYLGLPHPSGLAVDLKRQRVHVAATRNPNMVFDLAPLAGLQKRGDSPGPLGLGARPLWPVRARYYPGSCYFHDLALIGGQLHANAVGQNAVLRLPEAGGYQRAWWPKSIEGPSGPRFGRNELQLNSIAAGKDLASSYFTASVAAPVRVRPGQLGFKVDRQGVVFSGRTRRPVAGGLTRPHSLRLHRQRLWVANSGYGELGLVQDDAFVPVFKLPGWTRGLALHQDLALAGTSRVIPRFKAYAPGLDVGASRCGLHLLDTRTGRSMGSLTWPWGNQIFAIEAVPAAFTLGFAQVAGRPQPRALTRLAYAYAPPKGR